MGYQDGMWDGHLGVLIGPQAPSLFSSSVGRAAQTRQISHVIVADRQEIRFPLPSPGLRTGDSKGRLGQFNLWNAFQRSSSECQEDVRSQAVWSDWVPLNPTDVLHQDRWLRAGVGRATSLLTLFAGLMSPPRAGELSLRDLNSQGNREPPGLRFRLSSLSLTSYLREIC